MAKRHYEINRAVALPQGLTPQQIVRAVQYVETQAGEWLDLWYEQENLFSAVIGVLGARALETYGPFQRNPHKYEAQTRFPDLVRRGAKSGAVGQYRPEDCLESKGSKRVWALQAHYNHAGWYVVWRYMVDPTRSLGRRGVVICRVDVKFLEESDWKYRGSSAGEGRGGRTHTFDVINPAAAFHAGWVYRRRGIVVRGGRFVVNNDS